MSDAPVLRMVALLGEIARTGRSARLTLDPRDARSGAVHFQGGVVAAFVPPGGATQADGRSLREAIGQALLAACRAGARPRPAPAEPGQTPSPAADALTAADLALDLSRHIENTPLGGEAGIRAEDVPQPPASPPAVAPRVALGPKEAFLVSRGDGLLTIQQILEISPFDSRETLRAIFALVSIGLLATPARAPAARRPPPPRRAPPEKTVERRLSDLDRFLKRTGSAVTASPPATAPAPARASTPAAAPAPRPEPDRPPAPRPPQPSRGGQSEREELLAWARTAGGSDHYAVLGVDRASSEDQIRHAYYRLARRYHPDRLLKPHLEDIHRELETMFAAITEAYNTLSDPAARTQYDRELLERAAGRRKDADRNTLARDAYLRGRREMDAGKLFEAIRLFETAIENDASRAEYFHFLGVCEGQNPRWRKRAEENLLKAISLNPSMPQSYLELARVYHKGGLERRAHEMYDQVLRWDPTNEEAQVALGRQHENSSSRIFRSIFRKD